jgi:hypothetical protein
LASHRQLPCVALMAALFAGINAQTPEEQAASGLDFRFEPQAQEEGVPQAFRFELVNTSGHDVWAPQPSIQCEDSFDGWIHLTLIFRPSEPGPPPGEGSGCVGDRMNWPSILDRIKAWKVLHSGDSLALTADHVRLFYDSHRAGRHEFWATYFPPSIRSSDQAILRQAGIDFPHGETDHPTLGLYEETVKPVLEGFSQSPDTVSYCPVGRDAANWPTLT